MTDRIKGSYITLCCLLNLLLKNASSLSKKLKQNLEWWQPILEMRTFPGWEPTLYMNGLSMIHYKHGTSLVVLTFSSLDDLFFRCLKQSKGGFIREKNFTHFSSNPHTTWRISDCAWCFSLLHFLTPSHPHKVSLCVQIH